MQFFFTQHFKRQLRRLGKKHPSVKADLVLKIGELQLENEVHIGRSIFKVRIKSADMNKGKSGGFRAYLYLYRRKSLICPLCIYAKADRGSITENELNFHFRAVIVELQNIL